MMAVGRQAASTGIHETKKNRDQRSLFSLRPVSLLGLVFPLARRAFVIR